MANYITLAAAADDDGRRLDRVLRRALPWQWGRLETI
jgi:hypothetical protein